MIGLLVSWGNIMFCTETGGNKTNQNVHSLVRMHSPKAFRVNNDLFAHGGAIITSIAHFVAV